MAGNPSLEPDDCEDQCVRIAVVLLQAVRIAVVLLQAV